MKYLSIPVIALVFLFPQLAGAQGFVPCDGLDCSFCHFVGMANTILVWLIGILFVVFAVMLAVAGFGLVTSGGNPEAKSKAKSKLVNAIIGIIVVLAAWLLVDTIMRAMLSGGGGMIEGYGLWSKVECTAQAETSMDSVGGGATGGPAGVALGTASDLTQGQAVSQLTTEGLKVKSGAQLEGVHQHVLDNVIALNDACSTCNTPITITEGTGGTHATGEFSHANGYKLDLRTNDNPGLVTYIEDTYVPAGEWTDGTKLYYDSTTCGTYAIEGNHVDVVYKTGC